MIARSDDELEMFKKMDMERKVLEQDGKARLIEEHELPEWLTKDDDEIDRWDYDEEETILGRGSRQRKEVDYTDSLTEKEWMKAIDDTADYDEDLEEEDRDKKRRSRKRKPGRPESEDEENSVATSSKRKKGTTDPKVKRQMRKVLAYVIKYADAEGRVLSDPFMKLPSRKELPDYYEIIKKPVDIKKILTRIEEAKYVDFADLERDFFQLCQNAQIYNEEASLIYEDSIVLQSVFSNSRQKVVEEDSDGGEGE
jgi:SWI/SNF-related matrix-associated actin-dependent regulator of chromatin subfamily A member 2/4